MNKILLVHTSWYEEYIKTMIDSAMNILTPEYEIDLVCAPGAIAVSYTHLTLPTILLV